ncbi:hypothetical protein KRX57_01520 [Weeksellaceae bacterium TAE3-ERU29]|nr:hypothetical protein [Weeksellaceae bacterium TAE3-ERU29]
MNWISINDARLLIKKGMYRLETGAKSNDQLIYDNRSGKFVGHIENGRFFQESSYQIPTYVKVELEKLNQNDWFNNKSW